MLNDVKDIKLISYTKRISSALGTVSQLGLLCEQTGAPGQTIVNLLDRKVEIAIQTLIDVHTKFGKMLTLPPAFMYGNQILDCGPTQLTEAFGAYWYHPGHLGSSSYITNLAGEITQHTCPELVEGWSICPLENFLLRSI